MTYIVKNVRPAVAMAAAALFALTPHLLSAQSQGATAKAELKDGKGQTIGTADLQGTPHGVLVKLHLTKAPAGQHAFHVHETGKCEAPGFKSAGAHFNPTKAQHGFENAKGHHAGDLPNLHIPENGQLEAELFVAGASLGGGQNDLLDADGADLVLHATGDDYRSDPAGNAGDRVACGEIKR